MLNDYEFSDMHDPCTILKNNPRVKCEEVLEKSVLAELALFPKVLPRSKRYIMEMIYRCIHIERDQDVVQQNLVRPTAVLNRRAPVRDGQASAKDSVNSRRWRA